MKNINNELDFENFVKNKILIPITKNTEFKVLENKKAVDIMIAKNGKNPKLYFIEIKYFKDNKGRLGVGQRKGGGFQPEILASKTDYFESNLKWILGSEHSEEIWIADNDLIRTYLNGGEIGNKHNGIQKKFFKEMTPVSIKEIEIQIKKWLKIS